MTHMDWTQVSGVVLALGVIGGFLLRYVFRPLRRTLRNLDVFLDDWNGTPARPGVPERPGVLVRLDNLDGRVTNLEATRGDSEAMWEAIRAVAEARPPETA